MWNRSQRQRDITATCLFWGLSSGGRIDKASRFRYHPGMIRGKIYVKRQLELDLLRVVAAVGIVLYHYTVRGYAADSLSILKCPVLGGISNRYFLLSVPGVIMVLTSVAIVLYIGPGARGLLDQVLRAGADVITRREWRHSNGSE